MSAIQKSNLISVPVTRAAWLSPVRAVKYAVNSTNGRNPYD